MYVARDWNVFYWKFSFSCAIEVQVTCSHKCIAVTSYMATCFLRKGAWTKRQIPVNIGNDYASNVAWVTFVFIHREIAVAEGKWPTVLHWEALLSKPPRTWGLPSTECAMASPFQAPGAKLLSIPTRRRMGRLQTDDGTKWLRILQGKYFIYPLPSKYAMSKSTSLLVTKCQIALKHNNSGKSGHNA